MKIGIVTHYGVHNHGAVLQLTALAEVLRGMGHEAHALAFEKNYDFLGKDLKAKYNPGISSAGIYLKYLKEEGVGKTAYNFRKRRTLNLFKAQKGLIGPYYTEGGEYDLVVVGSDEVFALHTGPTPLFFGHAAPSGRVISYAGSFGPTTMADIDRLHCSGFVKSGIGGMEAVSVRDENSRLVIGELLGRTPQLVCDPVILYGFGREIAAMPEKNVKADRYMLVYAYDNRMNDPAEVAGIKACARAKGLKIVSPGFYHSWADENVNCDPVELLRWFRNAEIVVTDTFHGSVMSIITGAPMAVKTRDNANKLLNLLREYGLENRVMSGFGEIAAKMDMPVDWAHVNGELQRRRAESLAWLTAAVEGKGL